MTRADGRRAGRLLLLLLLLLLLHKRLVFDLSFSFVSIWIEVRAIRVSSALSRICLSSCMITFLQLHRYSPSSVRTRTTNSPLWRLVLYFFPFPLSFHISMVFSYVSGCLPFLLFIVSAWTKISPIPTDQQPTTNQVGN